MPSWTLARQELWTSGWLHIDNPMSLRLPRRYATNQEVIAFFAILGIEITNLKVKGRHRHLTCREVEIQLPMDASPDECVRLVRAAAGL
jgi:hypothetical protein